MSTSINISSDPICHVLTWSTYRILGVLDALLREGHLVHIEGLVLHLTQLLVVHLAAPQHLQGPLLERVQAGATCRRHLLLEVGQLRVTLVDFGLDHLATLVQLFINTRETQISLTEEDMEGICCLPFGKSRRGLGH